MQVIGVDQVFAAVVEELAGADARRSGASAAKA
jgi:hypothetical protein